MEKLGQGGEGAKERKRNEAWHTILASGELITLQNEVIAELEEETAEGSALVDEFRAFAEADIATVRVPEEGDFAHPGLVTRQSAYNHALRNTDTLALSTPQAVLTHPEETLLRAFTFLEKKVAAIALKHEVVLSDPVQEAYESGTDLEEPHLITAENVTTYFDIFRFVTKDAETVGHQKRLLKKLLTERPDYRYAKPGDTKEVALNPQKETDLELLARAPFSFWAKSRFDTPLSLDGEDLMQIDDMDKPLFSNRFMYFIARERIADKYSELLRHGGCPALHPDFKPDALIRRTGETYFKFYDLLTRDETS